MRKRQEYVVTIDRSTGKRLGVDYDDSDGVTLVIKGLKPGLIYDWICKKPSDVWVHLEDAIIEVNGVKGDSELIEKECAKPQVLNITFRPAPVSSDEPGACISDDNEVLVHVYDLWGAQSRISRPLNAMTSRLGIFHTGVEVYGREWYFCGTDRAFYGVYAMPEPKNHPLHRYRRTVHMGPTGVTKEALEEIIPLLRLKWPAWSYHLVRRNCHHFTDFFCRTLGFHAGPKCGIFGAGDPSLFLGDSWLRRAGCLGCCRPRREMPDDALLVREPLPYPNQAMMSRLILEEEIITSPVASTLANATIPEVSRPAQPESNGARCPRIGDSGSEDTDKSNLVSV
mmetsp:Transcript_57471/g.95624  ORF Transcript_57471/g.95624 Transcript_57471/m.95624 type:complete len:340 (-) Transcript_57471:29-1048(-)